MTIELRYDLDTNNFFNTQAKKDLMQEAANSIANQLTDTLSPIQASGTNSWSADFFNPATGVAQSINNLVVPANTIVIFVGGRMLNQNERGFGGPGGFSWSGTPSWGNVVQGRGQPGALTTIPTDFSPWGGSITFDTQANWFFGQTTTGLTATQTDFLSVAEHEIGHVLGIGELSSGGPATSWSRFIVGGSFAGPSAESARGGTPVPLDAGGDHWATGTRSAGQEAAMTPVLVDGTRKLFTPLDFAGLVDVGWQLKQTGSVGFTASGYVVNERAGTAAITVSRVDPSRFAIVHFATNGGTATAGQDYAPLSIDLLFGPGEVSKTLNLSVFDDARMEGSETVRLYLSNFLGASPGPITQSLLTIVDDEAPRNGVSDFDGDGKTDIALFRPSQARWLSNLSGGGTMNGVVGTPNLVDIPVAGDYDGDGKTDLIVFRPSTGQWIGHLSLGGSMITNFGNPNLADVPVVGDFDGDGKSDLAVFRVSTGRWIAQLSGGGVLNTTFGQPNLVDIPAPGDYDGDGKTDLAIYRPGLNRWIAQLSGGGVLNTSFGQPNLVDIPAPGDYDGDGKTDLAVYRPAQSCWIVDFAAGGEMTRLYGMPNLFDVPTTASFGSLILLGKLTPVVTATAVAPTGLSAYSIAAGALSAASFADVAVPAPTETANAGLATLQIINITRAHAATVAKRELLD